METSEDLTKQQAYEAMEAGKKITHSLFGAEEFLYMTDGNMYEEAGYRFEAGWEMRTEDYWLTGWRVY